MKIDSIQSFVRNSSGVAIGTVQETVTERIVAGVPYFRRTVRVVEAIGGQTQDASFEVDIANSGRETAQLEPGREYVFYLGARREGAYALTPLSRPVTIPEGQRAVYARYLRSWAEAPEEGAALREYVVKLLIEAPGYFARDAARVAPMVAGWTQAELERLRAIVTGGEKTAAPPQANERDGLVVLLTREGEPGWVTAFARAEAAGGSDGDMIYYGLSQRDAKAAEGIVTALYAGESFPEKHVAVRVAGLLGRVDLLDRFEKSLGDAEAKEIRQAIQQARKLRN
ncbi:MAG: hypothetical protein FJW30_00505 [Acidobacteria bacterium]|nr:hypothetical protein [Acidobacteriota bacterium]